jgi:hypothetical protein
MRSLLALGVFAALAAVAVTFVPASTGQGTGPSRTIGDYALFATQRLRTKGDLTVRGLAVGVNDGSLLMKGPLNTDSQNVAVGGNGGQVRLGAGTACATLFTHVGGAASIGAGQCTTHETFDSSTAGLLIDDPATACGFPSAFPACDPSTNLTVGHGQAVSLSAPAGTTLKRGKVLVRGGGAGSGTLILGGGTYSFCSLRVARGGTLLVDSAAQVFVSGDVRLFPGSVVGPSAVTNPGSSALGAFVNGEFVRISRNAKFTGKVCAPKSLLSLGFKASVTGNLVARVISTDRGVTVKGTAPPPPVTTTTPSSTVTSTTSPVGTTSTTVPQSTSTTEIVSTTTSTTLQVQTTLTAAASADGSLLDVSDTTGFAVGDNIQINPGGGTQENNTIASIGATAAASTLRRRSRPAAPAVATPGSFTLETPLQHDHAIGEIVVDLGPTPPPTTTSTLVTTTTSSTAVITTTSTSTSTTPTTIPTTTTSPPATTTTSSTITTTSTSTSTSIVPTTSTTSTTIGATATRFKVTIQQGSTSCGGPGLKPHCTAGSNLGGTDGIGGCATAADCGTSGACGLTLGPPPAAPLGGEIDKAGSVKLVDLAKGCLYFGGGTNTAVPGGRIPSGADVYFHIASRVGTTLTLAPDAGVGSRPQDNCTEPSGPSKICLDVADLLKPCTVDTDCPNSASAGRCGFKPNCFFGPPLPSQAPSGLSTCLINTYQSASSPVTGMADTAAGGATSMNVPLSTIVYLTGNFTQPCPVCSGASGTCSRGPNAGMPCTALGAGLTTTDCPSDGQYQATLPVALNLTTGQSSMTEMVAGNGLFCPGQTVVKEGAIGQKLAAKVIENGTPPAAPISNCPSTTSLDVGSVFCIPNVSPTIDGVAGLPGPGAITLATAACLAP